MTTAIYDQNGGQEELRLPPINFGLLFSKFEYFVFLLSIFLISGGIGGLYNKLFNMSPPTPVLVVLFPILLAMVFVMVVRLRETFFGIMTAFPFFLLGLLMAVSFIWSDFPSVSLREGVVSLIIILYLGYLGWRYRWAELIEGLWRVMFILVLVSYFLYIAVPSMGRMSDIFAGTMSGVWFEKNGAGQAGVFGALCALARMGIKPRTFISSSFSFLLFTGFLLLSTSKTALVSYMVGCGMFGWVFMMRRSGLITITTMWATVFLGGLIYALVKNNTEAFFGMLGKSSTFTGRAEIWEAVGVSLNDRPLLGHGYSAYWDSDYYLGRTISYVFDELAYTPHHAHNSLIETGLNLGFVGVLFLGVGFIMAASISLIKVRVSHGAYLAIPFVFSAAIIGTFESVLAYPTNYAGAIIVLICAKMIRRTCPQENVLSNPFQRQNGKS